MPTYQISAPDGNTYRIEGPAGATDEQVQQEVLRQFPQAGTAKSAAASPERKMPNQFGLTETAMHVASQAASLPFQAGASLYGLATGKPGERAKTASKYSQAVGEAMTYQPRSEAGQVGARVADTVLSAPARGVQHFTHGLAENPTAKALLGPSGSKALEVGAEFVPQAALAVVGPKAFRAAGKMAGAEEAAATPAAATARAKAFVDNRTTLDWGSLSADLKAKLTQVAQDARNLTDLDPRAIERQARLERLGLPGTRGQITRDLGQLTREEAITKSDAGADIRNISAEQDRVLHQHLDTLRQATGGKAETQTQLGESVQGALRSKLSAAKRSSKTAYDFANMLGEKELADAAPLREFLKHPINEANVGWIASRLEKLQNADGSISLKNLEDVRQELTAAAKNPNKGGHYASEAAKVIDKIMDDSGSTAYKNARQTYKAMKDEFDKQGRVKKLVTEKRMSSDRAVALEDTFDMTVRKGSAEDLTRVKNSLTATDKGQQAWRDLQAATIDYLREKAAGKRAIRGEQEQLQFNSSFIEALDELDKDGKLDVLFSKDASAKLREIRQAVGDIRTKPAGRIAGSDTVPRMLNILEKVASIPGVGHYAAGVAKGIGKVRAIGEETRQAAKAKHSPLDELARKKRSVPAQTLESLGQAAPAAPFTLQSSQ